MIRNFCTYFDSYYIDKGIALYKSLEGVYGNDFCLFVMAMDQSSYNKLKEIDFSNMRVELLSDFETPELLEAKKNRLKVEYCWTCGPSIIYYFLTTYKLSDITYLDSDLYFINSPEILYKEIGDKSVAITDHYSETIDPAGQYCVQFLYFKNDENGLKVLGWWKDECIKWCYARFENNKYADQKYLESFHKLYSGVVVIQNRGAGVASWNCMQYDFSSPSRFTFKGAVYDVVFYHEHAISYSIHGKTLIADYRYKLNKKLIDCLFDAYSICMIQIFNSYFGADVNIVKYQQAGKLKLVYQKLRALLKENLLVRFIYYKIFGVKSNVAKLKDKKKC